MSNIERADNRPVLRRGSRVCQCGECGAFFSGPSPFQRHIMGTGTASPWCMSATMMRNVGMRQNSNGVWLGRARGGRWPKGEG
jgi:hypothetical protein